MVNWTLVAALCVISICIGLNIVHSKTFDGLLIDLARWFVGGTGLITAALYANQPYSVVVSNLIPYWSDAFFVSLAAYFFIPYWLRLWGK